MPFSSDCTICGNQLGSIGKGTAYGVRTVCRPCARWLQVWVKPLYEKNNENWQHGFGPCQHSDGNCVITGENRLNCFPCTLTKAVQNGLTYDGKFPYIRTYYMCSIFFFFLRTFFLRGLFYHFAAREKPKKIQHVLLHKMLGTPCPICERPIEGKFYGRFIDHSCRRFFHSETKKIRNKPSRLTSKKYACSKTPDVSETDFLFP